MSAVGRGDWARGLRLIAAGHALGLDRRDAPVPFWNALLDRYIGAARERLGPEGSRLSRGSGDAVRRRGRTRARVSLTTWRVTSSPLAIRPADSLVCSPGGKRIALTASDGLYVDISGESRLSSPAGAALQRVGRRTTLQGACREQHGGDSRPLPVDPGGRGQSRGWRSLVLRAPRRRAPEGRRAIARNAEVCRDAVSESESEVVERQRLGAPVTEVTHDGQSGTMLFG